MLQVSDKIRLSKFLKSHLKGQSPTFWEGQVSLPFGSFDLRIFEVEDDLWKWEVQIWYSGKSVFELKANSFHPGFGYHIEETLEELGHTYYALWKDKVSEVCDYLDKTHGIAMTRTDQWTYQEEKLLDIYKMAWTQKDPDDEFGIQTRIQVYTTEKIGPILVLDSILIENKYSYSISLEDVGYKEVIDQFFGEINSK